MLCEPDFGVLDRLMQIKPKALDFVYEGLTMFAKNKTNLWRDQLSKEQLEMAMESARRSKQKQKDIYIQRKKGKSLKEPVRNFKKIISWNKSGDNEKEKTVDFSRPVFAMPAALPKEKESLRAHALQATDKENEKLKDLTQKTSRKRAGENKIVKKKKELNKMKQIQ